MLPIDAAAGADVVAHLFEPGELVSCEDDSRSSLFLKPTNETLTDVFFEGFEWCCWFDGSTDERDKIGKPTGLRRAAQRAAATTKSIPDFRNRLRTEIWL